MVNFAKNKLEEVQKDSDGAGDNQGEVQKDSDGAGDNQGEVQKDSDGAGDNQGREEQKDSDGQDNQDKTVKKRKSKQQSNKRQKTKNVSIFVLFFHWPHHIIDRYQTIRFIYPKDQRKSQSKKHQKSSSKRNNLPKMSKSVSQIRVNYWKYWEIAEARYIWEASGGYVHLGWLYQKF